MSRAPQPGGPGCEVTNSSLKSHPIPRKAAPVLTHRRALPSLSLPLSFQPVLPELSKPQRLTHRQGCWKQPRRAPTLGLGSQLKRGPQRLNPLPRKATLTQAAQQALFTSTTQGPHATPSQQGLVEGVATQGKAPGARWPLCLTPANTTRVK